MYSFAALLSGMIIMGCSSSSFPTTPLFSGIEGTNFDEGKSIIEQRVANKYRIGSSDAGLADYLRSQGMTVNRSDSSGATDLPVYGQASFVKKRGVCDLIVGVDWRADRDTVIRDISVRYSDVGCM